MNQADAFTIVFNSSHTNYLDNTQKRAYLEPIIFKTPFNVVPRVGLGFLNLNVDHGAHGYIFSPVNITKTKFDLLIEIFPGTVLREFRFRYIATCWSTEF